VNAFCSIPTLPLVRRTLRLYLLTTWGDDHYVGLTSIEVFDEHGMLITVADPINAVTANPYSVADCNDIHDPRTPDKVIDGVCATCDDSHAWLAPYVGNNQASVNVVNVLVDHVSGRTDGKEEGDVSETRGEERRGLPNGGCHGMDLQQGSVSSFPSSSAATGDDDVSAGLLACRLCPGHPCNTLTIHLETPRRISMVRFWNYNKDRIHSSRGVRHVAIVADHAEDNDEWPIESSDANAEGPPAGSVLFFGEIRRASGHHTTCCNSCEPILFTDSTEIMHTIDSHDEKYVHALQAWYELGMNGDASADNQDDDEEEL